MYMKKLIITVVTNKDESELIDNKTQTTLNYFITAASKVRIPRGHTGRIQVIHKCPSTEVGRLSPLPNNLFEI